MKILLVEPNNFFAREFYYRLQRQGHDVKILTPNAKHFQSYIPNAKVIHWFYQQDINPYYLRDVDVIVSFLADYNSVELQENKMFNLKEQAKGIKNILKSIDQDSSLRKQKITFIQASSVYFFEGNNGLSLEDSSPGTTELSCFYQELETEIAGYSKGLNRLVVPRLGFILSEENPLMKEIEHKFLRWSLSLKEPNVYYSLCDQEAALSFFFDAIANHDRKGAYNLVQRNMRAQDFLQEMASHVQKKTTYIPRWLLEFFLSNILVERLYKSSKVGSKRYSLS